MSAWHLVYVLVVTSLLKLFCPSLAGCNLLFIERFILNIWACCTWLEHALPTKKTVCIVFGLSHRHKLLFRCLPYLLTYVTLRAVCWTFWIFETLWIISDDRDVTTALHLTYVIVVTSLLKLFCPSLAGCNLLFYERFILNIWACCNWLEHAFSYAYKENSLPCIWSQS